MKTRFLLLAATLSLSACLPPSSASTPRRAGGDAPIQRTELVRLGSRDTFTAVQALRPRWLLAGRPQTLSGRDGVVVYFETLRLGGLEALRGMSTNDIGAIQYLRPAAAQFRFGAGHLNGAIVITPAL
ncbi:hypothetical protein [Longimicrobium sp.]|uniref:hypothetical protein n=1 Tax=Longimicrobium sp. TaxID=2029185 RepID=UPI003B3A2287